MSEAPAAVAQVPWWQRATVYHVYPRSFADGNGDGIGDLPGIIARLDYLKLLGVDALWLSPFFASPQGDFGYDIASYEDVAPEYGSMADCERLIAEAHARGIKILFDLVLNHTSDQHPWFRESRAAADSPRRDWYLWRPGRKPGGAAPPNNWRALTGGSGWHHDPRTDAWYFASFLPFQPDLNYRNPDVREAMLGMVRRWLERGVDGFRLDVFNALYKDAAFPDNPFSFRPLPSDRSHDGFFQRRLHNCDLPETFAFARELRAVLDDYPGDRFLVGEVFGAPEQLRRYCGTPADPGLHAVFLFQTLRAPVAAPGLRRLITDIERALPAPYLPTWVLGNHDQLRVMNRLGGDARKMRLLAALQLTARAIPFIYYGEELGLEGPTIPLAEALDPLAARHRWVPDRAARLLTRAGVTLNRDECRNPMPWSPEPNAGFCPPATKPWRPLHGEHARVNVATEERDPGSLLNLYRRLIALRRRRPALHAGAITLLDAGQHPDALLGYRRQAGEDVVDVLLNTSDRPLRLSLGGRGVRVLLSTHGAGEDAQVIGGRELELRPYEAVILELSGDPSE